MREDIGVAIEAARPKLLSLAQRSMGREDAEDAVCETILRGLQSHHRIEGTLEGWLVGILRRVICEMRREREKEEYGVGRLAEYEESQEATPAPSRAQLPLTPLPDHLKAVVEFRSQSLTYEEIGVQLGLSARAVRYRIGAARRILQGMEIDTGFESAEEMFRWCSKNTVYRKPTTTGSGVARLRLGRLK